MREQLYLTDRVPTKWGWMVRNPENFKMPDLKGLCDIGYGTYIQAEEGVEIGEDVKIGGHCLIYSVSTIDNKRGKVTLKDGCRVGSHSLIMPGVTIGENAVVGAYSFVNKDIPEGVVAFGVPCEIKQRRK